MPAMARTRLRTVDDSVGCRPTRNVTEPMTIDIAESFPEIREGVRALCASYPGAYWRELDAKRAYPEAFVKELNEAGYLAALVPEEYGGSGQIGRAHV